MSKEAVERFREKIIPICHGQQEKIAKKAGISRVYLNRVLGGKAVPSLDVAENIAQAAGLTLSQAITSNNS